MKLTTQETEPTKKNNDTDGVLKKVQIVCIVLFILALLAGVQMIVAGKQQEQKLQNQTERLADLKQRIKDTQADVDGLPKIPETKAQVTRKNDNQIAEEFLQRLLTWDSTAEYNDTREWLASAHGIADTDALLSVFMPALSDNDTKESNMKYESSNIVMTHDTDGVRSYMALCEVKNKMSGNTGYGQVAVFYSVSADGILSSISAYSLMS